MCSSDNPAECCFTSSAEYTVTCVDQYADGWNGHQLFFDGSEKCAGFTSGATKIDTFTIDMSGIKCAYYWHLFFFLRGAARMQKFVDPSGVGALL